MTKNAAAISEKVVRDPKSGRFLTVRGAGALKGHLALRTDVDLTKPIASQVLNGASGRKRDPAPAKS